MVEPITAFKGAYDFLSNDYVLFQPIRYEDIDYPTVEHAFIAAHSDNPNLRTGIAGASSPMVARAIARRITLRDDWDKLNIPTMHTLLKRKFKVNPELGVRLAETGTAELIYGNMRGDLFWGAQWDEQNKSWEGKNHLGKMLMELRKYYRDEPCDCLDWDNESQPEN